MPSDRRAVAVLVGVAFLLAAAIGWQGFVRYSRQGSAAPSPPRAAGGSSALELEASVYDFGPVLQSQMQLEHEFRVTNRGKAPVDLHLRKVGCGCLEVACPETVPAGAKVNCRARLTLGGREGPLEVPAILETSEPGAPALALKVRCEIVPDVRVDPPRLEFRNVRSGEVLTAECRVITAAPAGSQPGAQQVKSEPPDSGVTVESLGTSRPEGLLNRLARQVHRYRVSIDTRRLSPRDSRVLLANAVAFQCAQGTETVRRALPVSIEFRPHNHLAGPRTITLRKSSAGMQTVPLKSLDGVLFRIEKTDCSAAEVRAEAAAQRTGAEQVVQLRYHDAAATGHANVVAVGQSISKCTLRVQTDRWPEEPYEIEILLVP
jgi:hypothetical protein